MMFNRCMFCEEDSSSSKSVEHIIPESLGGKKHTLPPGIVCDKCNNYFAREVEKPFLEHSAIKALRFNEGIESKKGVIPPIQAILNQEHEVRLWKDSKGEFAGHVDVDSSAFNSIMTAGKGTIIFPVSQDSTMLTEGPILSRFLGKVVLEGFVHKLLGDSKTLDVVESLLNEFIRDDSFVPLKRHVRRGVGCQWPCNVRRIYDAQKRWFDIITGESYQVMNEFDFLITDESECYFVMALFGMEYTINIGGPSIEGYLNWLKGHKGESPLYWGKNNPGHRL